MIQIITRYGNLLLLAMGQTLLLALCGLFFACILGMFFGLLSVLKNKACRIISSIFVDVIRGVPMIVLAYFIYFGVPYCLNNMIGFNSVDSGQMEAARSLGLPYSRAMIRVVLPQAIRTMIPSIINQFIITLKDTSILSVIGFPELVNTAKNVVANSFMSFQTWGIVAVMYLIVITILSKVAKIVERRLNRGRK